MSSIIQDGDTFNGISVNGRGVFTDENGNTYAGQCKDGYACGLGVVKSLFGFKVYAEHGPNGQYDGRHVYGRTNGHTFYRLFERGKEKDRAIVSDDDSCQYNGEDCEPDDPRLLALIAQVAPVEVRPAAPAPQPATQTPSNRPMRRFVLPPQALAKAMATEVQPHATRRR
jgi:hypothetical protein